MENAVLGPASDDESYTSASSDREGTSSSDADEIEKARRVRRGSENSDEKKSDSVSLSGMSLQERSQLQRDKQLRFLREQGLIKDEADVRGGAGTLDNVSVTSSTASPDRRISPGKRLFGQNKRLKSPNSHR